MKAQVKAYLDTHAKNDAVFAQKMANPRKSIEKCIIFIAMQAKTYMQEHKDDFSIDEGLCGDIDDEICYGWANHYYDEDNLEIDMTEEEKKAKREAEAKKRAEQAKQAKAQVSSKKTKTSAPAKTSTPTKASAPKPATPKADTEKTEKTKLTRSDLKKGNDCFDLFSDFFS